MLYIRIWDIYALLAEFGMVMGFWQMIFDGHIHLMTGADDRLVFRRKLDRAGVSGGIIMSLPPRAFEYLAPTMSAPERLDNLLAWCSGAKHLFPFFWIDPMEPSALRQVTAALAKGVAGFKIITAAFEPGHARAMRVYRAIAEAKRPILFHSGILWDGKASSQNTRPAMFEPLLEVKNLRFALAHIGWPWCEELLAVYGKFLNASLLRNSRNVEMFMDLTPGTPLLRRETALTMLFKIGYDVERNVFFGSDCRAGDYQGAWVKNWLRHDRAIYRKLKLKPFVIRAIYKDNLLRFVKGGQPVTHRLPRSDSSG